MIGPSDQRTRELIDAAVAGDAEALSGLLRLHGPAVEATLRIDKVWRALLEPADIMQVTYIEAFRDIARFDAARPGGIEGWLRGIAENNLRDAIRGLERDKRPSPQRRVEPGGDEPGERVEPDAVGRAGRPGHPRGAGLVGRRLGSA